MFFFKMVGLIYWLFRRHMELTYKGFIISAIVILFERTAQFRTRIRLDLFRNSRNPNMMAQTKFLGIISLLELK